MSESLNGEHSPTIYEHAVLGTEGLYADLKVEFEFQDVDPHRLQRATQISMRLLRYLNRQGHNPLSLEHSDRHPDGTTGTHTYLTGEVNGKEIIIEPSWQRFLPEESASSDLPSVLIGAREEVIEQAIAYGVPKTYTKLWQRPHPITHHFP